MAGLLQSAMDTIRDFHMIEPGDRIIIGLSGGADSVCLLSLLCGMREEWGLELKALHVHHGLRGEEADRDADYARTLCAGMGVAFSLVREDVATYAKKTNLSVEEAGRRLRYEALEREASDWDRLCGKTSMARIAVAHQREDQAETILHNLFRGSGLKGLSGIPPVRERVIRPLICTGREEILEWLDSRRLEYCQDSTNASDHYTRNRIRNVLMPYIIEQINQRATDNILRTGNLAGQADVYLEQQADEWRSQNLVVTETPGVFSYKVSALVVLPQIMQTYIILRTLKEASKASRDLTARHVEQVRELLYKQVGRRVALPYGIEARRGYDRIWIGPSGQTCCKPFPAWSGPAVVRFPYEKGSKIPENQYTKWFDYDKIKDTPLIRTRESKDYIMLSSGARKTVNRYMIDEKIPREARDSIPVLADGSHIMWIIGFRISEYYKIGPDTRTVLQVSVSPDSKSD